MRTILFRLKTSMLVLVVIISCNKNSQPVQNPSPLQQIQSNQLPIAVAGADQIILLPTDSCEIKGNGTDPNGTIVSYQWKVTGYYSKLGQYVYFNFSTQNAKMRSLKEGLYWCELRITDNRGLSATDEVIISVVSKDCPCYPTPCDAFGDPCDPWDY